MNRKEFENALEVTMDAVLEQYIRPLTNGMCLLTYAVAHKKDGAWLAERLHGQADTCPADIAGKGMLHALAEMASLPDATPPCDVQNRVNISLRLIRGGKDRLVSRSS